MNEDKGRIVTEVKIENGKEPSKTLTFNAMVDTGAAYLVLPDAWRDALGELEILRQVTIELGDQSRLSGEVCGPIKLKMLGFSPIYTEVMFVHMHSQEGSYEPLLGYIPLEQSQAAVDMVSHRLVPVKTVDLQYIC